MRQSRDLAIGVFEPSVHLSQHYPEVVALISALGVEATNYLGDLGDGLALLPQFGHARIRDRGVVWLACSYSSLQTRHEIQLAGCGRLVWPLSSGEVEKSVRLM